MKKQMCKAVKQRKRAHASRKAASARKERAKFVDGKGWRRASKARVGISS